MKQTPHISDADAAQLYLRTLMLREYICCMLHMQQCELVHLPPQMQWHRAQMLRLSSTAQYWQEQLGGLEQARGTKITQLLQMAQERVALASCFSPTATSTPQHCASAIDACRNYLQCATQETDGMLTELKWHYPGLVHALGSRPHGPPRHGDITLYMLDSKMATAPRDEVLQLAHAATLHFIDDMVRRPETGNETWHGILSAQLHKLCGMLPHDRRKEDMCRFTSTFEALLPFKDTDALRRKAEEDYHSRDIIGRARSHPMEGPDNNALVNYLQPALSRQIS